MRCGGLRPRSAMVLRQGDGAGRGRRADRQGQPRQRDYQPVEQLNITARRVIDWTRGLLSAPQVAFSGRASHDGGTGRHASGSCQRQCAAGLELCHRSTAGACVLLGLARPGDPCRAPPRARSDEPEPRGAGAAAILRAGAPGSPPPLTPLAGVVGAVASHGMARRRPGMRSSIQFRTTLPSCASPMTRRGRWPRSARLACRKVLPCA